VGSEAVGLTQARLGYAVSMDFVQVSATMFRFPDEDQGDPVQPLWRLENEARRDREQGHGDEFE